MTDRADEIAGKAVAELVADLSDRRGLKSEWHRIHKEIQQEIRSTWQKAIAAALREYAKEEREAGRLEERERITKIINQSTLAEIYIGPLFNAGWDEAMARIRAGLRADKGEA